MLHEQTSWRICAKVIVRDKASSFWRYIYII